MRPVPPPIPSAQPLGVSDTEKLYLSVTVTHIPHLCQEAQPYGWPWQVKFERRDVFSHVEHLVVNATFHSSLLFSASEVTGTGNKASINLGLQMTRMSTIQLLTHIGHTAEGKSSTFTVFSS